MSRNGLYAKQSPSIVPADQQPVSGRWVQTGYQADAPITDLDPDPRVLFDVGGHRNVSSMSGGAAAVRGAKQRVVGRARDAQQSFAGPAVIEKTKTLAIVAQPQHLGPTISGNCVGSSISSKTSLLSPTSPSRPMPDEAATGTA